MITQELITYIKQQLALGKSAPEIKQNLLSGGGWLESEIDQAFIFAGSDSLSTTVPTFAMSVPTVTEAPIIIETGKKFPYGLVGCISIIAFFSLLYFQLSALVPVDALVKGAAVFALIDVVLVLVHYMLTSLYKLPTRSFGKALFMVGVPTTVLSIIGFICKLVGIVELPKLISVVVGIGIIIAWVLLFSHIYKTGTGKAFWVGFWQWILSGIVGAVVFFVVGFSMLTSIADSLTKTNSSTPIEVPTETTDSSVESEYINKENVVDTTLVTPQEAVAPKTTTAPKKPESTTSIACTGTEPTLKIISPLSGSYKIGESITIKWETCNAPKDESLVFDFIDSSGKEYFLGIEPNSGEDYFNVSEYSVKPGIYKLQIRQFNISKYKYTGYFDTTAGYTFNVTE